MYREEVQSGSNLFDTQMVFLVCFWKKNKKQKTKKKKKKKKTGDDRNNLGTYMYHEEVQSGSYLFDTQMVLLK